ncbi:MAG: hypothetical protein VW707_06520, partial [Candidatus Puniceispirillum sp.]
TQQGAGNAGPTICWPVITHGCDATAINGAGHGRATSAALEDVAVGATATGLWRLWLLPEM